MRPGRRNKTRMEEGKEIRRGGRDGMDICRIPFIPADCACRADSSRSADCLSDGEASSAAAAEGAGVRGDRQTESFC